jgi:hypothetical protein
MQVDAFLTSSAHLIHYGPVEWAGYGYCAFSHLVAEVGFISTGMVEGAADGITRRSRGTFVANVK